MKFKFYRITKINSYPTGRSTNQQTSIASLKHQIDFLVEMDSCHKYATRLIATRMALTMKIERDWNQTLSLATES